MRKSIFVMIAMGMLATSLTSAQNLNKILDNHFKAIGQKKLLDVNTLTITANATMMGSDSPFNMVSKRPGKVLITLEIQGAEIKQGYDGETVWMINPMMGGSTAVEVTGAEAVDIMEAADIDRQLWNYKKKGHQLEFVGTEAVNGAETYDLKLTKKNGIVDHYYLDKNSFLILRATTSTLMNGAEVDVESNFSNYKEFDGYRMALTMEQKLGGQTYMLLEMDEVKLNAKVDDSIFSKPD